MTCGSASWKWSPPGQRGADHYELLGVEAGRLLRRMRNGPLPFHAPKGAGEGRFDRRSGAVMVPAAPGVVVNVSGGFERDGAVGVFSGEAGWLVQAGSQRAGGCFDVEARAVDEEDGVAVAQQREGGVGVQREAVGEAGLAWAEAEVPSVRSAVEEE